MFYCKTIPAVLVVNGVSFAKSMARSLILNKVMFVCDYVEGGVEFIVQEKDKRVLNMILQHFNSLTGHEIL